MSSDTAQLLKKNRSRVLSCSICGIEFAYSGLGRPPKACGDHRDRRWKQYDKIARRRSRAVPETYWPGSVISCSLCGTDFVKRVSHQQFCSALCRYRAQYSSSYSSKVRFQMCWNCNQELVTVHGRGRQMKFCPACRAEADRRINVRKMNGRRAGGRVEVSYEDLAIRDGRRCQICLKKLDLRLPSTHDYGPTLDHILPVSRGGTNESNNLRLAHRICNMKRGNRLDAQMLLEVG